ncbi:hypothetical protein SODALDRAFT_268110 [Sodiomyces alkalinus F11]|uniref:ISWI chromatin-remodeling complex ATPase ISW2 n=1 Tax=Sodiomyces alkalinus (strain CBS 110278 / VKM F-3762 / F11) TaxID=1314773 RepID=A0A3N2Q6D0_SODAK|nr:hypothetical protein SODALDRAFT_268110 [Sodiomyces alkalinus F11]ROT42218.1 hypothetical protein SODALDRAFT_268110 [Sodiomyces alkalinus F11]
MSRTQSVISPNSSPSAVESPPAMQSVTPEAKQEILDEEEKARLANLKEEEKRQAALKRKRKNKKPETKAEREQKARELDDLLRKSAAFSDILTKKTQVLGRVGSGFDGKALGEHDLEMAKQPKSLVGGTMRDYQLEGLTWMYEICQQGMSGILADEMGLGKTVQVISLIALLREEEYLGPHLVVAPLSTLSNWINEFKKWCPSIPAILYHGTPQERAQMWKTKVARHLSGGRPTEKFPVVCTSYEILLREKASLSRVNWGFIIIDEGHRMKNFDSKLFRELRTFSSATRMLITGTPLQNNLRELWSLLHFLLPTIFTDWDAFESWFDFSDLEDAETTKEFIGDRMKQELVKKIHLILQPLLLRRIKADVAKYLPKKREYILYAPLTEEQRDLYHAIADTNVDSRAYLQNKVLSSLTAAAASSAAPKDSKQAESGVGAKKISLPVRSSPRKTRGDSNDASLAAPNAFSLMMGKKARGRSPMAKAESSAESSALSSVPSSTPSSSKQSSAPAKRKSPPTSETPPSKSAKSSRHSTPAPAPAPVSTRGSRRSTRRARYTEADSDEEKLSDDEFEAKLAEEVAKETAHENENDHVPGMTPEEVERTHSLELAKMEVARKKMGNPLMQLRLAANSPHNFYNPWGIAGGAEVDETVVTASGKMLLLDRLLPALFERGHKVLIFSQFKTQLDILHDYCALRKLNVCRIDGSVSQEDRQLQIDEFNKNPDLKVFLLATRAGGQGINLTAADTVILFDSDWNPQQDLQAQDRCHRIGQTRPVIVYRLATKGTVEEHLLLSVEAKRRLEKLVIKGGSYRTMGQKLKKEEEELDEETLKALLLKDAQVYKNTGAEEILSDHDLDILCDRSDEAYERAAVGKGNADGFKVVETGANGILTA